MSTTKFSELSLQPGIQQALDERGFIEATAVQAQTIPLTRSGVDILAQSQTGTGKTLAFCIPALERIQKDVHAIQVMILSPTRELAQQCADEVRKTAKYLPHIHLAEIFGGSDYNTQFRALRKANIVIGTPGRIMDHLERGTIVLPNLEMIILDEADEMLNMGFKEDVETILSDVPESRQTVLFSATVPKSILEIARQFQKDPVQVNLTQNKTVMTEIKQLYVDAPKQFKKRALTMLLHQAQPKRAIIFTNTKSMVDELAEELCADGFLAQGLHGDMKQNQRSTVMASFKGGRTEILVATDVAARGIDVQDIDYVFNYDLPKITEYYVHRIGRTGRAGRTGTSISICCSRQELDIVKSLARKSQSQIQEMELPTRASIEAIRMERNIEKLKLELTNTASKQSEVALEQLLKDGYDLKELACALISINFEAKSLNIEDIPQNKRKNKPEIVLKSATGKKSDKSQSNMLMFNIGHSDNCRANHLVGAITEHSGISSKNIGKIIVEEDRSLVAIPAELATVVIQAMKQTKICGKRVHVVNVSEDLRKEKSSRREAQIEKISPKNRENKSKGKRRNLVEKGSKTPTRRRKDS